MSDNVIKAYHKRHGCTNQLAAHVLTTELIGQLKGWWDEQLTLDDKDKILNAIKLDLDGEPIL